MTVRLNIECRIFYVGYRSLVQIIFCTLKLPVVVGGRTQLLIATSEPGAVAKSPINHTDRWRVAAVESKRRAMIHVASEPDTGLLDLLGAKSGGLSDEPRYLGQNVGPSTNVADLV